MDKLKIGIPLYINTLPLLFYLPKKNQGIELVLEVPKRLNQLLRQMTLCASLSSSVVYAKNPKEFLILPDLSISAVGEVKSVVLYHEESLSLLDGKPIGITPETESSFLLLRVLLEDFVGVKPKYIELTKNWKDLTEQEKKELKGYLAIGDEALILQNEENRYLITDLAELWLKYTNFPFVFALFIMKKEFMNLKREITSFCLNLYYARAKAFSNLKEVVDRSHLKLPKDFVHRYLTHLEYDFSGLKQRAYLYFCELLYKKKLIPALPELNFFSLGDRLI
ncbi:menaquinone biosynthesis protein [Thermodesulfobacterium sp. TA1]|uniref:menaquinone biosynthetic enzyme MqnA/MqnD family protein n=1 Tax=Thermodesulfobacterium sp. TA1 TaxID=2234087 RepID=UPI001232033D|nr:menaquinone biosynthesis protein [Thermodesulfobacterium sp. TA1]QER42772.1 menaquinone biosynthesis protein [Thermodesulfobacterium sp. TA1]